MNGVLLEPRFATQPERPLICVATGADGLLKSVRQSPDVILLDVHLSDLHLPDMDGREVLWRLKLDRHTRGIPVETVRADAMPVNLRGNRSVAFEYRWIKPLDLPTAIARLKRPCPHFGRCDHTI